jgi:membrane-associated protein
MQFLTLTTLVPWVIAHGYFLFYIVSVIEGTLTTIAAGVATGFGYYNLYIIILIAIAGDITGDIICYFIGYKSRNLILDRHGHLLGLTKEKIEKIGQTLHKHFIKTMLVIKLSPFIAVPGLIAIGASRVPIKKFVGMSLFVTAPKSIFFVLLGFYSIKTYIHLTTIVKDGSYILGGIIVLMLGIYIIYKKTTSHFAQKANII